MMRRAAFLLVLAVGAPMTGHAQEVFSPARPLALGLGFCAPPVKPNCVDDNRTYANAKSAAACNQDMERFVRSVFAYRGCLNSEMERAVRETNQAIFLHKCKLAKGKNCG